MAVTRRRFGGKRVLVTLMTSAEYKALRARLSEAQNHRCAFCGARVEAPTLDHFLALAAGGETSWENCIMACLPCNNRKGNTNAMAFWQMLQDERAMRAELARRVAQFG